LSARLPIALRAPASSQLVAAERSRSISSNWSCCVRRRTTSLTSRCELLREPSTGETRAEILSRIRSKPLPCLRCSPLAKRYGWGFHFDGEGKIAVHAAGSKAYQKLAADPKLEQVPAIRSKKAP
jgi:hypothetical protein